MNVGEILELAERLIEFGEHEGAEVGEYWCSLGNMASLVVSCGTEEFEESYVKELSECVEYAEENFKLVETEETYTRKVIKLVEK